MRPDTVGIRDSKGKLWQVPRDVAAEKLAELRAEDKKRAEYKANPHAIDRETNIPNPGFHQSKGKRLNERWKSSGSHEPSPVRHTKTIEGGLKVQVGLTIEEAMAMIRKG